MILLPLLACREPEEKPLTGTPLAPESASDTSSEVARPPNLLVIFFDDLGVDKLASYGEHPTPAAMPNLDALASRSLLFRNAWASSTCSPGRATLLTGRYSRRFGIGQADRVDVGDDQLPPGEQTIPEMLKTAPDPWSSSLVGKWHLAGYDTPDALQQPGLQGFDWYHATMGNLNETLEMEEDDASYYSWELDDNGVVHPVDTYVTTHQIDDAIARIESMPEPWFLFLSLNAPHTPLTDPPPELLLSGEVLPDPDVNKWVRYHQTLEATDTELGRLLERLDLTTTNVFVTADNGTPDHGTLPPLLASHAKLTLYEGGINVPLLAAGPAVAAPGAETDAIVHLVDLFPTFAEIAGAPAAAQALDGVSLMPLLRGEAALDREVIYAEEFGPNGPPPYRHDDRAVRDARYKLRRNDGVEQLFDLEGRYDDGPNLLEGVLSPEQQSAYDALSSALAAYEAELQYAY